MKRYKDWIKQADEDLNAAKDSEKNDHFEWACFQAQQSAEKSLKSFLLFLNVDTWGHGLVHLLRELKKILKESKESNKELSDEPIMSEYDALKEKCQELDMHYIQPRYPNGFASGYPAEYYNKKLALKCIEYAKAINQFIKKKIEKLSSFQ